MKFRLDDKKQVELSLDSPPCKLTKGLHTTLFLGGMGFWHLQPRFVQYFGGAEAFCRAWAIYMGVKFDGNCSKFYERFDFDIIEKADELTELIRALVNRDIEPTEEVLVEDGETEETQQA